MHPHPNPLPQSGRGGAFAHCAAYAPAEPRSARDAKTCSLSRGRERVGVRVQPQVVGGNASVAPIHRLILDVIGVGRFDMHPHPTLPHGASAAQSLAATGAGGDPRERVSNSAATPTAITISETWTALRLIA